jgi:hypothetical protein
MEGVFRASGSVASVEFRALRGSALLPPTDARSPSYRYA